MFDLHYHNIILKQNKSIVKSRSECDITRQLGDKRFACPVTMSNMKSVQTLDILRNFDESNWFYVYHRIGGSSDILDFLKHANEEDWNTVSISIGIKDEDINLLRIAKEQWDFRIDYITIDLALSHNDVVKPTIDAVHKYYPDAFLICGNGNTPEWVEYMESLGVDCVKLGIGVSGACRTRQYTGFGSPMVTAIQECSNAANNIKIMTDGGLTVRNDEVWIGDIAKSIRFGADFVMSGSLFSRCTDSPAIFGGYYGNASRAAKGNLHHVEGTKLDISTNGLTIRQQMDRVEDSLRSAVSYAGGKTLDALKTVDYYTVIDQ